VLEGALEAACCKHAVKRGCIPLKQAGGEAGTPDRVFLLPKGKVLVVEFKAPNGRLSPRQKLVFEKYGEAGHPVFVIRDTAVFKMMLDALLQAVVD